MVKIISICGADCAECKFYLNLCNGCVKDKGQPFWCADIFEDKTCPIFKCAIHEKKHNHCGECDKIPCNIYFELKDPESSEEEHKKSIHKRVEALKSIKK